MRILAISNLGPRPVSPWEGMYLPPRMRGLEAAGHQTVLIKPDWSGAVVNLAMRVQSGAIRLPPGARTAPRDQAWRSVVAPIRPWEVPGGVFGDPRTATARIAQRIAASVGAARFDVIQAHGMYAFWAGGVAEQLSQELGVPYTVTLHGSDLHALKSWRRGAFRRIMSSALGTMFVSEALRAEALRHGLAAAATAVTPNGFDGGVFHASGRSDSDPLRVLFVGNLKPVKGADRLPGILRAVRAREPDATLTIVGTGPLGPTLRSELEGSGTRFLGWLQPQQVAEQMRNADVLVVPSRSEGWGCVITEARACGTRVAATEVGGIPEAIGDGGTMVRADPFDPAAMARAILEQWGRRDAAQVAEAVQPFEWRSLGEREAGVLADWIAAYR